MIHPFWRLSEAGPANLALAFTDDGLLLGHTSLIERRDGRYVVRERHEIERLLKRAYHGEPPLDRLVAGFDRVASALNANDRCLARIAAVHLKIPDLASPAVRDALAAEDSLIKYARDEGPGDATWNPTLHPRTGTPPNPGWFAPTDGENSTVRVAANDDPNQGSDAGRPEERSGSKTPKPSSSPPLQVEREMARPPLEGDIIPPSSKGEVARTEAVRIANRQAIRLTAILGLRMAAEAAANIIPILDVLADVLLAHDAVQLVLEWRKLKIERQAAFDFVSKAPYTLEELQVHSPLGYEEFFRYDQFIKIVLAEEDLSKRFGSAGDGYQYHHVVTQGGANATNIRPELIQNTDNIARLPRLVHEAVTAAYQEPAPEDETKTLYEWVQSQPYTSQREEGLRILRRLRILK
jgi:hypothetical protein